MKQEVVKALKKVTNLSFQEIEKLIETPPSKALGDYAFPCFILSKKLKQNPNEIAISLSKEIISPYFEKVETKGPYLNIFLSREKLLDLTIKKILKEKGKYGSFNLGKNKKVVIEMSSPNIAKPFGIGHLRSTIIGNSISNINSFLGFRTIKINYLGDWG